jgi:hypothetical protein
MDEQTDIGPCGQIGVTDTWTDKAGGEVGRLGRWADGQTEGGPTGR